MSAAALAGSRRREADPSKVVDEGANAHFGPLLLIYPRRHRFCSVSTGLSISETTLSKVVRLPHTLAFRLGAKHPRIFSDRSSRQRLRIPQQYRVECGTETGSGAEGHRGDSHRAAWDLAERGARRLLAAEKNWQSDEALAAHRGDLDRHLRSPRVRRATGYTRSSRAVRAGCCRPMIGSRATYFR